jgi:hypothetical protein
VILASPALRVTIVDMLGRKRDHRPDRSLQIRIISINRKGASHGGMRGVHLSEHDGDTPTSLLTVRNETTQTSGTTLIETFVAELFIPAGRLEEPGKIRRAHGREVRSEGRRCLVSAHRQAQKCATCRARHSGASLMSPIETTPPRDDGRRKPLVQGTAHIATRYRGRIGLRKRGSGSE